jgi:hypothetical protein
MQSLLNHDTKASASTRSIAQSAIADITPSAPLVRNTVHQIKTFLFAGQDTTAHPVQWLRLQNIQEPEVSYRLREEHDLVFGPGASSAADMLSQPVKPTVSSQAAPHTPPLLSRRHSACTHWWLPLA